MRLSEICGVDRNEYYCWERAEVANEQSSIQFREVTAEWSRFCTKQFARIFSFVQYVCGWIEARRKVGGVERIAGVLLLAGVRVLAECEIWSRLLLRGDTSV